MGTMSYGFESMDEVAHQLPLRSVLGTKVRLRFHRVFSSFFSNSQDLRNTQKSNVVDDRCPARNSWATRHIFKGEGHRVVPPRVTM